MAGAAFRSAPVDWTFRPVEYRLEGEPTEPDPHSGRCTQRPDHLSSPPRVSSTFLPALLPGEVEIARIEIDSITRDVISVRARPTGSEIVYRVVDEYPDNDAEKPRYSLPFTTSARPLSLEQLVRLLDGTMLNHAGDPERWTGLVLPFNRGALAEEWGDLAWRDPGFDDSSDEERAIEYAAAIRAACRYAVPRSSIYRQLTVLYELRAQVFEDKLRIDHSSLFWPFQGRPPTAEEHFAPVMEWLITDLDQAVGAAALRDFALWCAEQANDGSERITGMLDKIRATARGSDSRAREEARRPYAFIAWKMTNRLEEDHSPHMASYLTAYSCFSQNPAQSCVNAARYMRSCWRYQAEAARVESGDRLGGQAAWLGALAAQFNRLSTLLARP